MLILHCMRVRWMSDLSFCRIVCKRYAYVAHLSQYRYIQFTCDALRMKRGVKHHHHHHHRHQQQPYTKCTTPHEVKYSHSFYEFLLFCIVLWLWVLLPFVVAAAAAVCIINCQSCADDVFFPANRPTEYNRIHVCIDVYAVFLCSVAHVFMRAHMEILRRACRSLILSPHFMTFQWEHIGLRAHYFASQNRF